MTFKWDIEEKEELVESSQREWKNTILKEKILWQIMEHVYCHQGRQPRHVVIK